MITDTGLVVLHVTKLGENSVVLHTIGNVYGRKSFLVSGIGRKTAMSMFLPMNILDAEVLESSRSRLFRIRNISCRHPMTGIRNNLYKNAMTMFISEVLYRVVKDGANEDGLFDWCEKDMLLLDAMKSDFSNFHIRFLLELAVMLGFSPDDARLAPFVGEHSALASRFLQESFEESMLIPLSGSLRNEIAGEILKYIEYYSESSVNVNSLKVLRELFC